MKRLAIAVLLVPAVARADEPKTAEAQKQAAEAAADRAERAAERAERAAERLEKAKRDLEQALAAQKEAPKDEPKVEVGGYLKPGFGFRYRPQALPKDRYEYGFFGLAGVELTARPFKMWEADIIVEFSTEALRAVTNVALFNITGQEGRIDGIQYSTASVPGAVMQEATVRFIPHPSLNMALGVMRIPFTIAQQADNSELMFNTRAEPNDAFVSGPDLGFTITGHFLDDKLVPTIGVFNGDSLTLSIQEAEARGVVVTARVDASPLGAFDDGEGDYQRGKFRIGFGAGAMVRPATLYDQSTGSEPHRVIDFRLSASLKMAVRGLYFAGEYLRRQQKDDFSSRPEVHDGAYVQTGYFFKASEGFGLEPIARVGFVARDETFDARLVGYTDAGLNLLPVAGAEHPDDVKVLVTYKGERHFSEREESHGVQVGAQLRF